MVILQQIKSKLYKSALLQKQDLNKRLAVMKGNRGKVTALKWGDLELKIDSMCPFVRIAWWNFPSEGDFNSTETWYWLYAKRWVISIANSREWQLFSEPGVMSAKFASCGTPHVGFHWGKTETVHNLADAATMWPARVVGKGTLWVCKGHQVCPELIRQKLDQSNREGLSSWLTANSCHPLASSC